ncbi:MAG: nucleoside-diphosphate sugar epimerase [Planctomycetes bacterium]|nr:nucleoside-diphosphate sugar epimerase [Planctomycetota bacterium]
MKFLITGGAGFIGSHLAELLLKQEHEVTVLDDLSTGRMGNIEHLKGRPGFEYRIGSALDVPLVVELVDRAACTIHLAAAVGVKLVVEQPVHTIATNLRATEVVLDAAARKGKKVLLASTSEVYGKGTRSRFREDDDVSLGATTRSRWAYACSKAMDEWLGFAYLREKGVPVIVARLFNTVGPRQVGRYGMVLPNFARQALTSQPITVFGDGSQCRCFAHVGDVVQALVRLLDCADAPGRVFNVGSDREISIRDLAQMVKERAGSESEITFVPYDEAYGEGFEDMPRRVPDVTCLREATGFAPSTSLETIVDDVIEDQRSRQDED